MKIRINFRYLEDFAIGFESVKNDKLIEGCGFKWILFLGFVDIERRV